MKRVLNKFALNIIIVLIFLLAHLLQVTMIMHAIFDIIEQHLFMSFNLVWGAGGIVMIGLVPKKCRFKHMLCFRSPIQNRKGEA